MNDANMQEHPFAQFIRILGRGKKGSRALTMDEAFEAMEMILDDSVHPEQLGAFLMLLRVKEESAEEVAGFVRAIRESLQPMPAVKVDLDWSSYAGKRRHLPWYILSALLLAENDIRVCMHGADGHTAGRLYTTHALHALGITPCVSMDEVSKQLNASNFAYIPLRTISARLFDIINLRPILGLRSPVHTVARMINPFGAPHAIQAIFHPGYQKIHLDAARLLGDPHLAVFKGEGGEVERNPDADCMASSLHNDVSDDEMWPALFNNRHLSPRQLQAEQLIDVWRGTMDDEYAVAAITGTTAIALKLMAKADTQAQALELARAFWAQRNRDRFTG